MPINLPETGQKRIVIVGAGFAGLTLVRKLVGTGYQIVLIDRNNYHQFQPLFYQVAMAGLEPSSISFPLRKMFRKTPQMYIRLADVQSVDTEQKRISTNSGHVNYDILVLAVGVTTNYYGKPNLAKNVFSLKSVADALYLRNAILSDFEKSLMVRDYDERQGHLDIAIVGGGPTGVELAGALAEMRKYILPREYTELNAKEVDIFLIEGSARLLNTMSEKASNAAKRFLEKFGVEVKLNTLVDDFDGSILKLNDGTTINIKKVIWAAGVTGFSLKGLPEKSLGPASRHRVDQFNALAQCEDVYVLGDSAYMEEGEYKGHPQVAQVAIQQARRLAKNLKRAEKGQEMLPFHYLDKGTLATIGRNKAVADLPILSFKGFWAWVLWLVVHLKSILGVKNKILVALNWLWGYLTYDQSLRIIIRPKSYQGQDVP
jgi:NADH dehydrogenase